MSEFDSRLLLLPHKEKELAKIRRTVSELEVAKNELLSLKPGRVVFQMKGNIFFAVPTTSAQQTVQGDLSQRLKERDALEREVTCLRGDFQEVRRTTHQQ
eukprot:TRINITY_DN1761_c0_g1_i1.p1 TRINITY_DN1761_c0_g1~~TRINITY_DN1761_c0_g1_i1.p1  ORF type:complete len:114 (-),score=39.88 TRINITY_DN1761_c0_g1_i1:2-301(-)